MQTFGSVLKKLRLNSNLTIEELALDLNKKYGTKLSKSSISRWENSGADPKLEFVRILINYFNVDSSVFMQTQENQDLVHLNDISSKLSPDRQKNVLEFAKYQYAEQQKSDNT